MEKDNYILNVNESVELALLITVEIYFGDNTCLFGVAYILVMLNNNFHYICVESYKKASVILEKFFYRRFYRN